MRMAVAHAITARCSGARRASSVIRSSVMPSLKNSCAGAPLRLMNGST
jgi:hypothetical protein